MGSKNSSGCEPSTLPLQIPRRCPLSRIGQDLGWLGARRAQRSRRWVVQERGALNQAGSIIQAPLGILQDTLTAISGNPVQVVLAGQTWNFQRWFRDAVSSNFTDAVSVAFL